MTLATATRDGVPSARIVLLKGVDAHGFTFFTDYRSRKGAELTENPLAALTFLWKEIERQVRIAGAVSRVSTAESEAYFRARPPGSRPQRVDFASELRHPQPARSSSNGYRRSRCAFPTTSRCRHTGADSASCRTRSNSGRGRPNRLHDRLRYRRESTGWRIERLVALTTCRRAEGGGGTLPETRRLFQLFSELHVAFVATGAHLARSDCLAHRTPGFHGMRAVGETTQGREGAEFREAVRDLRRVQGPTSRSHEGPACRRRTRHQAADAEVHRPSCGVPCSPIR
jgi:pyridoxamine 5'-phosphate oxidase